MTTLGDMRHPLPEPQSPNAAPEVLHQRLTLFNRRRLQPRLPGEADDLERELDLRRLERAFVEAERHQVHARAATAPTGPEAFVRWFEDLKEHGPGQGDPLFPWLAEHATPEQLHWFLQQEVAGEAGFDDLVALTQIKMPVTAKLELARNYWDEMGRGNPDGMHGPMLETLAQTLELSASTEEVVWEAIALGNLMVALAENREYAFHSVGALGAIELTAPTRVGHVNAALQRVGVPANARHYFALHATLDVKHSEAWDREVLATLVAAQPKVATAIAEGALMRLTAGQRCFERYRRQFRI